MIMEETKVKMRQCVVCRKEFNIYTRPFIARFTCSEECREVNRARRKEIYRESLKESKKKRRQKRKNTFKILFVVSIVTAIIGAMVGTYLYNAMSMVGDPGMVILIGFAVGFFAPYIFYLYDECG